jgi:phosphate transport system substrate-binding protein
MRIRTLLAAAAALGVGCAGAVELAGLPDYQPAQQVSGTIRSWGNDRMAGLMKSWEAGFRKYHPAVRFADTLKGTASAQFGLDEWVADLALMGREIMAVEYYAVYRRAHQYPVGVEVATGAYAAPHKTAALTIFVHKDNPLAGLTLQQLDGIFGAERDGGWKGLNWSTELARGPEGNIRTWGQLGLGGEWADKPIHPYGPPGIYPGGISWFQAKVLNGSDKASEDLREFESREEMIAALAKDRYGIAYAAQGYRTPDVRPVALARAAGVPFLLPTPESVAARTYPLARPVYIYFATDTQDGAGAPAEPRVDPKVREFLRYVLSRQGQLDVQREGEYLPLTADVLGKQRAVLER